MTVTVWVFLLCVHVSVYVTVTVWASLFTVCLYGCTSEGNSGITFLLWPCSDSLCHSALWACDSRASGWSSYLHLQCCIRSAGRELSLLAYLAFCEPLDRTKVIQLGTKRFCLLSHATGSCLRVFCNGLNKSQKRKVGFLTTGRRGIQGKGGIHSLPWDFSCSFNSLGLSLTFTPAGSSPYVAHSPILSDTDTQWGSRMCFIDEESWNCYLHNLMLQLSELMFGCGMVSHFYLDGWLPDQLYLQWKSTMVESSPFSVPTPGILDEWTFSFTRRGSIVLLLTQISSQ